jgi:hypothetical protein
MRQGQDSILGRIGKAVHVQIDDIRHEPLPRRWIELIHYLDEQERNCSARQAKSPMEHRPTEQTDEGPKAELAVIRQEKLVSELLSTGQPTEEARALLEDLRRRVARALTERG